MNIVTFAYEYTLKPPVKTENDTIVPYNEHVVANACYFTYAGVISWKVVLWFFIMAVGNALGAIFIQVIRNILDRLKHIKYIQI